VSSANIDNPPSIVDKVPELASISSISGASPAPILSNRAIIPIQCNEMYKQMSSNVIVERENNKQSICDFVKEHLFKRLKFYNSELLIYNTKKSSICQKLCNHLNMAEEGRITFWSTYSLCVENAIRVARNDVVQAMKSSFLGSKLPNSIYNSEIHILIFLTSLQIFSKIVRVLRMQSSY
jgi:hypothetical protein